MKVFLAIYYLFISKLPHSRYLKLSNLLRVWYCSRFLKVMKFDKNSKLEYGVYLSDAKGIRIGKCCRINENVFIQGEVVMGDYVMIAPNVAIHSSTHIYKSIENPMVLNGLTENKCVFIGDDVWIGRNSVVLPGIKIGKGSIIGANSLVNKDVEEYSIYGGVPAKFIKKRK